ncbi:hypothetical protein ACYULR_03510 [Lactobacillus delbrueckii subsp. lactis]|uniref:hypothetical protein n=1 Tax=Lactobacillus delbrueckii TaxID=1584 RepID=UPI001F2ED060|nr:hypothetical protein [Lactobacillus delbrueckii]
MFNAIHLNSIGYVFEFGPKEVVSTRKHSGSSKNWNAAHRYGTETSGNRWTSGGLTLATQLWEPRSLSLETNDWQQVGPVMEGLAGYGRLGRKWRLGLQQLVPVSRGQRPA